MAIKPVMRASMPPTICTIKKIVNSVCINFVFGYRTKMLCKLGGFQMEGLAGKGFGANGRLRDE